MLRRHSRRRHKETPELNITTFLNLMVVLVPFLLISAVFSRVTILELNVPTAAPAAAASSRQLSVEVIVRTDRLEYSDGSRIVATLPMVNGEYDLDKLNALLVRVKGENPQKEDATVLMEPEIKYDHLIQVMDTVRGARVQMKEGSEARKRPLFPDISIGDAP